jgi:hypothetical protein
VTRFAEEKLELENRLAAWGTEQSKLKPTFLTLLCLGGPSVPPPYAKYLNNSEIGRVSMINVAHAEAFGAPSFLRPLLNRLVQSPQPFYAHQGLVNPSNARRVAALLSGERFCTGMVTTPSSTMLCKAPLSVVSNRADGMTKRHITCTSNRCARCGALDGDEDCIKAYMEDKVKAAIARAPGHAISLGAARTAAAISRGSESMTAAQLVHVVDNRLTFRTLLLTKCSGLRMDMDRVIQA